MSGFLPSLPTITLPVAQQVAICSSNAAVVQATSQLVTSTTAPNNPHPADSSGAEQIHAASDGLAEVDSGRAGAALATPAAPETCANSLPHQLSPHADATSPEPHSMLNSSCVANLSGDVLSGAAAPRLEQAVPGTASHLSIRSPAADLPHDPAVGVEDGEGMSEACTNRLEGNFQGGSHSPGTSCTQHVVPREQDAPSPRSSGHHSWVTAPEGGATGSSCGGSLAEYDPLVFASPQALCSDSVVPHAIPATSQPIVAQASFPTGISDTTVFRRDGGSGAPSLLSAEPPDGGTVFTDAFLAATSTLSRMSAAHSQAPLLQTQAGCESASPSHPSSPVTDAPRLAGAGAAQPLALTSDRARLALTDTGSMLQTSNDVALLSGTHSVGAAGGFPVTSTSNPLYSPLKLPTTGSQQRQASTTADAASSSSTRTGLRRSGSSLLQRTGSSLKRALVRSLHSVKSFARTPSDPNATTGATLERSPAQSVQPLQRRSFVPKSSLFRSIQESIESIADSEHEGSDRACAVGAEAADAVATVSQSPLRSAPPGPGHSVHRGGDLEPLLHPTAGLHTPRSRTTSARSQLLPPSPAALVGSQLSESMSSQAQSATDASPALMTPGSGAHLVTPRRATVAHGQHDLLDRAEYDKRVQSAPLRPWDQHHGQRTFGDRRMQGGRHVSTLRRRSALAACFCGVVDQES